jgi:hypothetical protein
MSSTLKHTLPILSGTDQPFVSELLGSNPSQPSSTQDANSSITNVYGQDNLGVGNEYELE